MGTYTTVDNAFWTDSAVIDNFTPEDKYFYLYLLTNVHVNVSGCFEVSMKQIAQEMGYSKETVEHLVERFSILHKVIDYDEETKEILIHNWGKYHWTTSDKYLIALHRKVDAVKSSKFSSFLNAEIDTFVSSGGTVFIPYRYGIDTSCIDTSVTVTVKENNPYLDSKDKNRVEKKEVKKEKKQGQQEIEIEVIDAPLADRSPELIQAVNEWFEYKREKGKKYTERGRSTFLKKIKKSAEEYGDSAVVEVIEDSMANEYQGVVWDRLGKNNYGGRRGGYNGLGGFAGVDLGE